MPCNAAGKYIKDWLVKYGGSDITQPGQFDEALKTTSELAETDWGKTLTDNHKLAVCVAVLDAHIARDNAYGLPITPLRELREMVLNGSSGRPSPMNIPSKPPGKRAPVNKLWVRVCYTMLWEKTPDERAYNKIAAMKELGMTAKELSSLHSNIKTAVMRGDLDVGRLMRLADDQFDSHGWMKLTDYLPLEFPSP